SLSFLLPATLYFCPLSLHDALPICLHAGFLQEISLRHGAHRIGELKDAVDAEPARMHDLLRNPFPVEMGLFAVEMRVLKEAWPPASGAQGLFVVSDFVPRILPHWFPTVADLVLLQLFDLGVFRLFLSHGFVPSLASLVA